MVAVDLGQPVRIDGDIVLKFTGTGRARFRFQHARDCNGQPDDLSWSDVTIMSHPAVGGFTPPDNVLRGGSLVDWVSGDVEVHYQRHTASWVRVVPHLSYADAKQDEEAIESCKRYSFSLEERRT